VGERRTPDDTGERLVAASEVNGTAVYDMRGKRLGSVEDFMIDKVGGQVNYAVLSFGGFLGIGSEYYPLPWRKLDYDTSLGGIPGRYCRGNTRWGTQIPARWLLVGLGRGGLALQPRRLIVVSESRFLPPALSCACLARFKWRAWRRARKPEGEPIARQT